MKSKIVILILICTSFCTLNAQVKVVKTAKAQIPTCYFKGVTGNGAVSKQVSSDLVRCGWFSMVAGKADYIINGQTSGSKLQLNVYRGDGSPFFSVASAINSANISTGCHKAVDQVLQKMFRIPGICNSKIVFSVELAKGIKEIYICDFDGKNVRRITKHNSLAVEGAWTPKNTSVIYTLYNKGYTDVVEMDILKKRCRRLSQYPGLNSGCSVSPNQKTMSLILSKDGEVDLYLKTYAGRGVKRLTRDKDTEASPCWSPTGGQICYVSDRTGRPALYVIPARGGSPQKLPTQGSEAVSPDWSSDNKIVYACRMGRNYTIALLDLSGKSKSGTLVNAAGDWESPSWAPDNRHIICSRNYGGRSTLYIIDSWTGKTRQFLTGKTNFSLPNWSGISK